MILYIYSTKSRKASIKTIDKISLALREKYPNLEVCSYDEIDRVKKEDVEMLFFSGGDGTFHNVINIFKEYLDKITFGYIPTGTANDIAKNHDIKSLDEALKIINEGYVKEENLIQVNDNLFDYALSVGEMSRVSIDASKKNKKRYGKLIYKIRGIKYLFKKRKEIIVNGKKDKLKALIILRSIYLGGVKIGKSVDNMLHVYRIRSIIDVISLFVFNRFHKIKGEEYTEITVESDSIWCVDGEEIEISKGLIKVSDKKIKMLSKNT